MIGIIVQEPTSTQFIFDGPPNNLLKLDQLIVQMQKKGKKKIEKGKAPF